MGLIVPPPPAVNVLPPQSPPKGQATAALPAGQQSPFLDPTTAASEDLPGGSPKPFRIPSRPITPIHSLPPARSPRLSTSQPPSPPPPRRSAELRRDREGKQPPPPPAPRLDRSRNATPVAATFQERQTIHPPSNSKVVDETSPFNSPPGSPPKEDLDDEIPPELPMRPRRLLATETSDKMKQTLGGFEPPPVHHSVAGKRRGRGNSINGASTAPVTPQRTGDNRMAAAPLPQPRRTPTDQIVHNVKSNNIDMPPPPKPLRALQQREHSKVDSLPSSSPLAQPQHLATHQFPVPPTRTSGTLKPTDRIADLDVSETRVAAPSTSTSRPITRSTTPDAASVTAEPAGHVSTFPDGSNVNRRPPFVKKGCYEIQTKYDPRIFDICGELACSSGHMTRVWNIMDGEQLMSLAHTEGVKATAVAFKPAADPDHEGTSLWIGTNVGEIMEVDVATQHIGHYRAGIHGKAEVIKIYRHYNELWTLDEGGTLHVWAPEEDGILNLNGQPTQTYKLPKGPTFSMVVGEELWHATGKVIRVFEPSLDGSKPFQVLVRPLTAEGCGDVSAGTILQSVPGRVFLGHVDGKVSIFSTADYSCQKVLNVSSWKINALAGAGQNIWAAYNNGRICVYDIGVQPWTMMKEWQAHDHSVLRMKVDTAGPYRLDRLQIASLGADNKIKFWDGSLQDNWLEDDLKSKDLKYCEFEEIKALVLTWNAGASTPHSLRYSEGDAAFFKNLLQSNGSPEILIFCFQELVDLEDKTATAKRFLKSKKKEGAEQERMSHQYRDWRDFLLKALDDYMPADDLYHLLQTTRLVGLFTCIFVKSSIRDRIRNLNAAEVKRGMGGLHGNKGAIAVRFLVDDTSLCFVNCHLAAGQSQASSRHNDIAAILEANLFPTERDPGTRLDTFSGGGDGSMILDHELCILNGDLNYRIDTMSRDTVVKAVQQQQLPKLLERDQLLVARRRNAGFRLRAFEEMPITFAPTYKYDVGTDTYDTSEKRRSPAWCDRLLFRGQGRVRQLDYLRHEVRVSDHRPVTGNFRLWVKKVDSKGRAKAWMESQERFEKVRSQMVASDK